MATPLPTGDTLITLQQKKRQNLFLWNNCTFFRLIGSFDNRNGHLFWYENVFFSGFRDDFRFLDPYFGFCPSVSAVIEQSIRDNSRRILHTTSCRMISGFVHLWKKEAWHIDFYLKKEDFLMNFTILAILFQNGAAEWYPVLHICAKKKRHILIFIFLFFDKLYHF